MHSILLLKSNKVLLSSLKLKKIFFYAFPFVPFVAVFIYTKIPYMYNWEDPPKIIKS